MDFWDEKIAKVPIIEMEAIIRLQYPGLEGLQYLDDDRMFTWTYQGFVGRCPLRVLMVGLCLRCGGILNGGISDRALGVRVGKAYYVASWCF